MKRINVGSLILLSTLSLSAQADFSTTINSKKDIVKSKEIEYSDYVGKKAKLVELVNKVTGKNKTYKLGATSFNKLGGSIRLIQTYGQTEYESQQVVLVFNKNGKLKHINGSTSNAKLDAVANDVEDTKRKIEKLLRNKVNKISILSQNTLKVEVLKNGFPFSMEVKISKDNKLTIGQSKAIIKTKHSVEDYDLLDEEVSNIQIRNASTTPLAPYSILIFPNLAKVRLENGEVVKKGPMSWSPKLKNAHTSFAVVQDYYKREFDRAGYDNNKAVVNVYMNVSKYSLLNLQKMRGNAAWVGGGVNSFYIGAGDKFFKTADESIDVVGHEYTHAVIDSTSALVYEKQSGALNEHLADVFGVIVKNYHGLAENPYLIGDKMMRNKARRRFEAEAIRDMKSPKRGVSVQPSHVEEIPEKLKNCTTPSGENDQCGVHILSGIPNKAVQLMMDEFGFKKTGKLIYRVMVDRLVPNSNFENYKDETIKECKMQKSFSSKDCTFVQLAFESVGIK